MSYFIDHRNQQQNKEGVKTQRRADSRDPPEEENLPDLTRGSKLWAKFTATIKRNKTQEGGETKLLKPPEKTKNVKRCGRKKNPVGIILVQNLTRVENLKCETKNWKQKVTATFSLVDS